MASSSTEMDGGPEADTGDDRQRQTGMCRESQTKMGGQDQRLTQK